MSAPDLILLVDDNQSILDMIEDALTDEGFRVEIASSGEDAVAMLRLTGQQYAAVITDLDLGGQLNGWHVGRHARAINPAVAVFYMTGAGSEGWPEMAVSGGIFFQKPFPLFDLATMVRSAARPHLT